MHRCLPFLLLALQGCADPTTLEDLPGRLPTLAGPIVARDLQFGALQGTRNIHVRPASEECGIVFAIDERTTLRVRVPDGSTRAARLDDLTTGRAVRAWTRGVIMESCPGQTFAEAVELLE